MASAMPKMESKQALTNRFLRLVRRKIQEDFRDEERRREFEDWYLKTYGKSYVWKTEEYNGGQYKMSMLELRQGDSVGRDNLRG